MTGQILNEILSVYPTLPPAERRIADVILSRPRDVLTMTSETLARIAETSQPTTSRFCGRLNAGSFSQFKVQLAGELGGAPDDSSGTRDPLAIDRHAEITARYPHALEQTRAMLDNAWTAIATLNADDMRASARAIARASVVVTCGFNLSGSAAWRLASLLGHLGVQSRAEREPYHDDLWVRHLDRDDLIALVTYRGRVPQLDAALTLARRRGVTILVITNEAQSPVVQQFADLVLLSHAPSEMSDEEYTSGAALFVQLAVIRTLAFAVKHEIELIQQGAL